MSQQRSRNTSRARIAPTTSQASAHHDDLVFTLVRWVDQLHLELVPVPLVGDGAAGNLCVECHDYPLAPKATASKTMRKPHAMSVASTLPMRVMRGVHAGWDTPSDWRLLAIPCHKCEPTTSMLIA